MANPIEEGKAVIKGAQAVGKVVKKAVAGKATNAAPIRKAADVVKKPIAYSPKKEAVAAKAIEDMAGPAPVAFTGPHPHEDSLRILDKNIRKSIASQNPNSRRAEAEAKRVAAGEAPDLYKSNIASRVIKVFPNNTKLSSVDVASAKVIADALRSNPTVDTHILGSILEDNISKGVIDATKASKTLNKFKGLDSTTKSAFEHIWDYEKGTATRNTIEQVIKNAEKLIGD
jgi:hypothetical protein